MGFFGFYSFSSDYIPKNYNAPEKYSIAFRKGYLEIDRKWFQELHKPFLLFFSEHGEGYTQLKKHPNSDTFESVANKSAFSEELKTEEIASGLFFDQVNNTLSIARDTFGLIPIYYFHLKGEFILFSTSLSLLLNDIRVKNNVLINKHAIYHYLNIGSELQPYSSHNFYQNIFSILPGRVNRISPDTSKSNEYVLYTPEKWSHLKSVEEYGEEFAHLLSKSVRRVIRNKKIIGSQLSGGLDSSSISSLIHHLQPESNLHTFYLDTQSSLANEAEYALELANFVESEHHIVKPSTKDLDNLIYCTSLYGRPENMALSPSFQISMIKSAKDLGCSALLTGHDGDSIVGNGRAYLPSLFKLESWDEISNHLSNLATRDNIFFLHRDWNNLSVKEREKLIFIYYFNREKFSQPGKMKIKDIFATLKKGRHLDISTSEILNHKLKSIKAKLRDNILYPGSIHNQDVLSHSLSNSYNEEVMFNHPEQKSYYDNILFNQNIRINEEYFALSMDTELSIYHPFFDKELYELCLAVPAEIKFGSGYGRGHMREGMAKYLPSKIKNRKDKALFNLYSTEAALRLYTQAQDYLSYDAAVWNYVNQKKFNQAVSLLKRNKVRYSMNHLMTFFVNRTIFLSIWLSQKRT